MPSHTNNNVHIIDTNTKSEIEEVKESVHFIPVSTVKQVLNAALVQ